MQPIKMLSVVQLYNFFEDPRAHVKCFHPPEGEEELCPLHDCVGVSGPCYILSDVDAKELEALDPLQILSMWMGTCSPLFLL
jgi:hypothetical protein